MKSNYLSKILTLRNMRQIVGFYTEQMSVSCRMTSFESRPTTSRHMPCVMASERSSINALYSVIFFIDRPIHTPLKLTNSSLGSNMAQAVEDRFCELRLSPLAYPTNDSNRFDISNKCKSGSPNQNDYSQRKQECNKIL